MDNDKFTQLRLDIVAETDPKKKRVLISRLGGLSGAGSLGRRIAAKKGAEGMKRRAGK